MILRPIFKVLRQIFSLQKENTVTLTQIIDTLRPVPTDEVWLHTEDVMKLFKKTEKTLYNWRRNGQLRHKIIGRTVYYLKSDVYRILNKE